MLRERCLFVVLTFSLVGCATQPASTRDAVPVPAERVIDSRFMNPSPDSGEVIVKRNSAFFWLGLFYAHICQW